MTAADLQYGCHVHQEFVMSQRAPTTLTGLVLAPFQTCGSSNKASALTAGCQHKAKYLIFLSSTSGFFSFLMMNFSTAESGVENKDLEMGRTFKPLGIMRQMIVCDPVHSFFED